MTAATVAAGVALAGCGFNRPPAAAPATTTASTTTTTARATTAAALPDPVPANAPGGTQTLVSASGTGSRTFAFDITGTALANVTVWWVCATAAGSAGAQMQVSVAGRLLGGSGCGTAASGSFGAQVPFAGRGQRSWQVVAAPQVRYRLAVTTQG